MRVTFLYLLFIVICFNSSKGFSLNHGRLQGRFSPQIIMHQLFEMLRVAIRNGTLEKNMPVLDPFVTDFESIELPSDLKLRLNATVTNAVISGLSSFQLLKSEFSKDSTSIDLIVNIPVIKIQAEYYEMSGNLYGVLPIAGKGSSHIEIHDFNLKTLVYLKQSKDGRSILINRFENSEFSIRQIVSRTQFDDNIDDIVNAFIKDLLASYLSRFNKIICATYSDSVTALANSYLGNFESWRILVVIL